MIVRVLLWKAVRIPLSSNPCVRLLEIQTLGSDRHDETPASKK